MSVSQKTTVIRHLLDATADNATARQRLTRLMNKDAGYKFSFNGRNFEIVKVDGKKLLRDMDNPQLTSTYREIMNGLDSSIIVARDGVLRVPSVKELLAQNVDTFKRVGGYTDEQVAQLARQQTDRMLSSQASKVVQSLDNSTSVAQRAGSFRDTPELRRIASNPVRVNSANDVVLNRELIQTQVKQINSSGVAPKVSRMNAETIDVDLLKKNAENAEAIGRTGPTTRQRVIGSLVIGVISVIAIALFATLGPRSQSAVGMAAAAGTSIDLSQLTAAQRQEATSLTNDYIQWTFFQMVVDHQKFLNGCYFHNKIEGTLKKVQLLSCGSVATGENAMETCSFSGNIPSRDSCPENTFVPCLDATCTSIVYNGPVPNVTSSVTKQNACPTTNDNAPCSAFCRADNFALPEYVELICVNVDLKTAYVDLMDALGYNVQEMFPASPRHPLRQTIQIAFVLLLLVGVGVFGWMWYRRRRRQTLQP